jgi:hypothetical protein
VTRLAELATTDRQAQTIRALYDDGPTDPAEHAELLTGWRAAGRTAPVEDYERALSSLTTLPLRRDPAVESLFDACERAPKSIRATPEYLSWWLLFQSPPDGRSFAGWATVLPKARPLLAQMPEPRLREVRDLAAEVAVASLGEDRYPEGLESLIEALGSDWHVELGEALGRELRRVSDPEGTIALAFVEWRHCRGHDRGLLEEALPRGTRDVSPRRLEDVGKRLDESQRKQWGTWLEEHPPSRAVSRAVRGVFRRGEEGR